MKVKTSELQGTALDWVMAKCESLPVRLDPMGFRKDAPTSTQAGWWVWDGENQNQVIGHRKTRLREEDGYSPSTDWSQGGPIIEREGITVICWNKNPDQFAARYWLQLNGPAGICSHGPTPLVAAMRCYVTSKLGDEVEIPEELI